MWVRRALVRRAVFARQGRSVFQRSQTFRAFSSAAESGNGVQSQKLFDESLNLLFDGRCNLCRAEVRFLTKLDGESRKLRFTDIEAPDFDPSLPENGGGRLTYEAGLKKMHAITQDGQVIKGVPVFAAAYGEVGLGWLWRLTQYPPFDVIAAKVYDFWAARRTGWTRGKSIEELVQERNRSLEQGCGCDSKPNGQ